MEKRFGIRISDVVLLVVFTAIIFQNALMRVSGAFRFVDEILLILSAAYLFVAAFRERHWKAEYVSMAAVMLLIILTGVISNVFSDIERSPFMILLGISYFLKDFVCVMAAKRYFERKGMRGRAFRLLVNEVHIILLLALACLCVSQVMDIGMTRGVRYGIKCFKFVYSNAGMWSQYCIIFLLILTAELQCRPMKAKQVLYFAVLAIVWLSSCRTRGAVALAIWLFLMFIGRKMSRMGMDHVKNVKKTIRKFLRPQYVLIAVLVVGVMGWSQFQVYFGDEVVSARNLLVDGGFSVMRDYFPLGSGFGTFGTEVAATYYSPLYYRYGLNTFWALVEGGSELTDCYWPAVGAELGVFGLLLMAVLVCQLIWLLIKSSRGKKYYFILTAVYAVYLLISSTATGIFSSYVTAGFLIICMAILHVKQQRTEENLNGNRGII